MSEMKSGKIEAKEMKKSKNGKDFCVFTIDGKKYNTFDPTICARFNKGDNVIMTGQQDGAYWNMETMALEEKPKVTHEYISDTNKEASIYTSYAKDLFICVYPIIMAASEPVKEQISIEQVMDTCIKLIKQAKQAFGGEHGEN